MALAASVLCRDWQADFVRGVMPTLGVPIGPYGFAIKGGAKWSKTSGARTCCSELKEGGTRLAFFFGGTERFDVSWVQKGLTFFWKKIS